MKKHHPSLQVRHLLLLTSLFTTSLSFAQTTRTVCASGCNFTTIQAAVTAAASGDTIILNVNGAHTEKNIALPEKNLTFRGLGKSTTFLQSAASRANAAGGRIFTYAAPAGSGNTRIIFEDMTIRYAYAPLTDLGSSQFQSVGGVFYATGTLKGLTIWANRVRFYANETTGGNNINSGGACFYLSATGTGYTYNADIAVDNCDFDDNRVANSAGTSLSDGPCFNILGGPARLTINNSTFTNNSGYTRGGVIYNGANWSVIGRNSSFENNGTRNGDGGCFGARSGTWYFENCLFKNNSAVYVSPVNGNNGWGGVMLGKGGKFRNCTFVGNSAVKGGAICRTANGLNEELQLINCTFSGNSASSTGRAIQLGTSSTTSAIPLVMVNTIIANGAGAAATDLHFTVAYSQLTTNIKNYNNSVSTEYATPGTTPVFEFNSGNATLNLSTTTASNGGAVQTLALSAGSTLINAGTHASTATYDIPVKDNRNYSRADGGIDIGAFEYDGITDNSATPSITYTPVSNTPATTDRVITSTITDGNGVYWFQQLTDLRPRIYYRKNTGTWNSGVGTLVSGTGLNGTWNFTISQAAMGGLATGDRVYYYIISQDVSSNPSIISQPAGATASAVNAVTGHPIASSYLISATLPVKLESFTAVKNNRNALLNWSVSEEKNVSHYEVERSNDGTSWTSVGRVTAMGNRHYNFTDRNLEAKTYLYRLRSVDIDRQFTLSATRQVRFEDADAVQVYPNPVTDGQLNIHISKNSPVAFYNSNGAMLWHKTYAAGTHRIQLGNIVPGTYHVVIDGNTWPVVVK
jgi:hypothetical protein